jgi:UDPglucose--hexose-1-phosphate uridylyltransferase
MEFGSYSQSATFHSPMADFEAVTETVEVREDPLTGRTARIVDGAFMAPDDYDIDLVVSDDDGCFFCPENVETATPTYPDWMDVDRGSHGEATSFPNLNPYGSYSNVVALTETHFQPMEAFTATQFADGLTAALEYVDAVFDHDEDVSHASVNMNFLRSAGSSLVHPHLQTVVDDRGTNQQRELLTASRRYRDAEGSSYWADLVDAERGGDRWIGTAGPVDWLAAFAPKHHRHVLAVAQGTTRSKLDRDAVEGFADGLTNVLAAYADAGLNAFNFAFHVVDDSAFPPVMSVVARSVFDEYYWSDSPFFTVLHDEGVVDTPPETYAADVRAEF